MRAGTGPLVLGNAQRVPRPECAHLKGFQGMAQVIDGEASEAKWRTASTGPSTLQRQRLIGAKREARISGEMTGVALAPGDQVVDADHLCAVGEQPVDEVRPEESRAAGHDDARWGPGHGTATSSAGGRRPASRPLDRPRLADRPAHADVGEPEVDELIHRQAVTAVDDQLPAHERWPPEPSRGRRTPATR